MAFRLEQARNTFQTASLLNKKYQDLSVELLLDVPPVSVPVPKGSLELTLQKAENMCGVVMILSVVQAVLNHRSKARGDSNMPANGPGNQ